MIFRLQKFKNFIKTQPGRYAGRSIERLHLKFMVLNENHETTGKILIASHITWKNQEIRNFMKTPAIPQKNSLQDICSPGILVKIYRCSYREKIEYPIPTKNIQLVKNDVAKPLFEIINL